MTIAIAILVTIVVVGALWLWLARRKRTPTWEDVLREKQAREAQHQRQRDLERAEMRVQTRSYVDSVRRPNGALIRSAQTSREVPSHAVPRPCPAQRRVESETTFTHSAPSYPDHFSTTTFETSHSPSDHSSSHAHSHDSGSSSDFSGGGGDSGGGGASGDW